MTTQDATQFLRVAETNKPVRFHADLIHEVVRRMGGWCRLLRKDSSQLATSV